MPWPAFQPSGIVQGSDGNFYGPASGGNGTCGVGNDYYAYCGTIFKVTPEGTLTTLYSFCTQRDCTDGIGPSGLVQGSDGSFYGTTELGGSQCNGITLYLPGCGTVFKITPEGTLTTLHTFDWTDGGEPNGGLEDPNVSELGLIQGSDGNFYGTTELGGASGAGTLFKISPAGTLITLYSFLGDAKGGNYGTDYPGELVQAANGFYGITQNGGANQDGSVFSFAIGIGGTTPSTVDVGLSPASISVGSAGPVVMTAAVTPTSGDGTPTGVVAFFNGTSELGSANLSSGMATYSYNPSSLASGTYQITAIYSGDATFAESTSSAQTLTITVVSLPPAATPTLSPASGSYNSAQSVTISDTTAGATIYFTNDGTIPTTSSAIYSGPITVSSNETLNAIAGASGYSTSAVATATYTISGSSLPPAATPTFSPASGSYSSAQSVTIGDTTAGATIYYTDDGTTPTTGSAVYSAPISVNSTETINAIAGASGYSTSAVATATYTISGSSLPTAATPTFSPASGSYSSAQSVTIGDTTAGATIYFTNDGTTPTTGSVVYSAPIPVNSTETIKAIAAASDYTDSAVATATYSFAPDYQLSVTPASLTIAAGQSGTVTFTVTPMNGFNSQVSFSCSGLPSEATCTFNPPSVTPSDGSPTSSTLTISTTAASAALLRPGASSRYLNYGLLIPCLGMIVAISGRRKRSLCGSCALGMLALTALAAALTSCGSSKAGNSGTPGGTSTATLTATTSGAGAISHTAALKITITQ